MMQRRSLGEPCFVLAVLAFLALPAAGAAQHGEPPPPAAYALRNVTVHYADGRRETGVNVVVRRGLITALGAGAEIPADAMILEGDSLFVLPGLVDAHGAVDVGLPQVESMAGIPSWDPPRDAQGFTPHRLVAEYLTATAASLKPQRSAGVIAAGVHPEGGMAPGQSAAVLLRLTSRTPKDLVLAPSVGLLFSFQGARGVYPSSLFAVVAHFRQTFEDASRHRLILSEYARDPRGMTLPRWDPDFEILAEAASGNLPVFFLADDDEDIRRVLALADEIGFRPVIVGGEEAWELAAELAGRDVPVLVSVAFPAPRSWKPEEGDTAQAEGPAAGAITPAAAREKERLENAYSNAARLVEAGVRVALTSGGGGRDLLQGVRRAMEYGLSEGDALEATTTVPASILGIPHVVTLRSGVAANFIVTDGPLFREDTRVRYTFVEGEMEEGQAVRGAAAGQAPSVDVSGTWGTVVNAQGMELTFTMSLRQEGSAFSGTMSSAETGEALIEGGVVSGSSLSFMIVFTMGTESMELDSNATVDGDRMSGSGTSAMGSFTFTATRRPGAEGGIR
jgi:imidazolonepropionase-like amidohydrolase